MKTAESRCDAIKSSHSLWPACPSVWQTRSWGKVCSQHCVIHGFHSSLSLEPGTLGHHGSRADTCYWLLSLSLYASVSLRWTMQSDSFSSHDEFALGNVHLGFLSHTQLFCIYAVGLGLFMHLPPGNAEFVSSHEGHQGSSLQKDPLEKNHKSAGHQAHYRDDSATLVHWREEGPKSPWGGEGSTNKQQLCVQLLGFRVGNERWRCSKAPILFY